MDVHWTLGTQRLLELNAEVSNGKREVMYYYAYPVSRMTLN